MAYQVIARKYRPQRFEDVVGQDHVTRTLGQAIAKNRIAHAYLFCGPRGTGKTTLARIFAKCLNCTGGPSTTFAEDDERCVEIAEGRSLDVLEIDGASNRGIEEIRELRETVRYAPASAPFKIYIIDEVHMLTKEAFNALLKTLEEPPEHAKFMFATTEPEKVLPTILSRCQRFDLRRIPSDLIVKHLSHIAELEGVKVDGAALQAVARGADGGMRDAESTLDQLISFCGNEVVEEDVLSMFGMASRDQVLQLVEALVGGDSLTVLQLLDALTGEGKELGRLLGDILQFFRNLMLFQLSKENEALLAVSEAELAVLRRLSGQVAPDRLTRVLETLSDCDYRMKGATAKRIFFEVALVKTVEALQAVPLNEVLQTLKSLRDESGGAGGQPSVTPPPAAPTGAAPTSRPVAPPAPALAPAPASAPAPATPVPPTAAVATPSPVASNPAPTPSPAPEPTAAPAVTAAPSTDLKAVWDRVLAHMVAKSPFTHNFLKTAQPLEVEGRVLRIGFPPQAASSMSLMESGKNRALLAGALEVAGLGQVEVRYQVDESLAEAYESAAAAPATSAAEESPGGAESFRPAGESAEPGVAEPGTIDPVAFRNDPLIKEALEIFKGQLSQVQKSS